MSWFPPDDSDVVPATVESYTLKKTHMLRHHWAKKDRTEEDEKKIDGDMFHLVWEKDLTDGRISNHISRCGRYRYILMEHPPVGMPKETRYETRYSALIAKRYITDFAKWEKIVKSGISEEGLFNTFYRDQQYYYPMVINSFDMILPLSKAQVMERAQKVINQYFGVPVPRSTRDEDYDSESDYSD